MEPSQKITVETSVGVSVEKAWEYWTEPAHIMNWNNASDDWHTTAAENDLKAGGKFLSRMEAKDGSFGFDFGGVYDEVKQHELIAYTLGDGRKVEIIFKGNPDGTQVTETFDAESSHSVEAQQQGWQAILDNFKRYAEQHTVKSKT